MFKCFTNYIDVMQGIGTYYYSYTGFIGIYGRMRVQPEGEVRLRGHKSCKTPAKVFYIDDSIALSMLQ